MEKAIGLQALRRELSRIIGQVYYARESYIIEVYGKPAAVLLNIADYRRLHALERLVSPRFLTVQEALGIVEETEIPAPWPASTREAMRRMLERRAVVGIGKVSAADLVAEGRAEREVPYGQ